MVPQQPLHPAMFTKTVSRFSSKQLHSCTNPYRFDLNQISFLGTSGQFVEDIRRSTHNDSSIDIMSMTLGAGHIGKIEILFVFILFMSNGNVKLLSISLNLYRMDRIINYQCILFFKFIVKDVVQRFVRIFKILICLSCILSI
jgi:hypothetical protein